MAGVLFNEGKSRCIKRTAPIWKREVDRVRSSRIGIDTKFRELKEASMKRLNITVNCMAIYNSLIIVPDELGLDEAIEYAKEHLDEAQLGELEYVSDSDCLDEENCSF